MARGRSKRSGQRRYALRILFEMDMNGSSVEEVLEGKRKAGEEEPDGFTLELVKGVQENIGTLDGLISGYSQGWEIDRMPLVDRNVLRMSLYELFCREEIPPGATIDEAVELAKSFSTEGSGKFVNGVLGRVNRDREKGRVSCPPR